MISKSGHQFERRIFGCHSTGDNLVEKFKDGRANFQDDIEVAIKNHFGLPYPNTRIGKSLYRMVKKELLRLGIDSKGLLFLSAINTKVDVRHYTDGLFYLPSVPTHPVTVDVFNIDSRKLLSLKNLWVETFEGKSYSGLHFQSDLFRYKKGMKEWNRQEKISGELFSTEPLDLRMYGHHRGRPENHFILTPHDVETPQWRKEFARMVAGYFVEVSRRQVALGSS